MTDGTSLQVYYRFDVSTMEAEDNTSINKDGNQIDDR